MSNNIRPRWSSQFIYILAAVGAAAGLGNLWRFPMLAYEYGGGAFILVLLLANIFIVYPLMMFETVLGQRFQASGPVSLEKMKSGTGWIYCIPIFATIFMVTYYTPVMAWAVQYFFRAFSGEFLTDPPAYFMEEIIGASSSINEMGAWQLPVFLCLLLSYAFILWSLRKGLKSVSKVIMVTATLPFFLLILLIIRGVTLPGAGEGLRALFIPDWSALGNLQLWQAAIGQAFFSAALATSYFTMSGSYRAPKAEIPKSSALILIGNFTVSILSGLAVFSTLGFMAQQQGVPLSEAAAGGPPLIFIVFPTAISMMPSMKILFAVLLFFTVITLAIDSIFAAVEQIVAGLRDMFPDWGTHFQLTTRLLILTFILGIPLTFGAGLYYLDILDHFISGYTFMFIGFLESAVVAYWVGPDKIRTWINETATTLHIGKWFNYVLYFIPIPLIYLFVNTLLKEFDAPYSGYPLWSILSIGLLPFVIILPISAIVGRQLWKRYRK